MKSHVSAESMIREHLLEIVLIESDDEHDEDAGEHAEHLEDDGQPVTLLLLVGGERVGVTRGQLGHHVHQRHVQEYPCNIDCIEEFYFEENRARRAYEKREISNIVFTVF